MKMNKKALSPIITTVMLILIALVLASIIFLWARGFNKEQVAKFDQPIESACDSVKLDASLSGDKSISLINNGEIPVYKISLLISGDGDTEKENLEVNLAVGGSKVVSSTSSLTGKNVKILPVLLGSLRSDAAKNEEYSCVNREVTLA